MKEILILVTTILFATCSFGQEGGSNVKYIKSVKKEGGQYLEVDCSLSFSKGFNVSNFVHHGLLNPPKDSKTEVEDVMGNKTVSINRYERGKKSSSIMQKAFGLDSLYSLEKIYGENKNLIVKEKLPKLKWEIHTATDTILNHTVRKATTSFRGREWTAWFAPSIQIPDGPFKFQGLPGLILSVKSKDGLFSFRAYSLQLGKGGLLELEPLNKVYDDRKQITIPQKLALIQKNITKHKKYQMSKNPNVSVVKVDLGERPEKNFDDVLDD